ncbi:MAG: glycosyltransferase family 4 protein [Promethearchaeota archaeon]
MYWKKKGWIFINILWIPHQSWLSRGGITRDKHLIGNLKKKHEIHVIQHTQPFENNIVSFLKSHFLINSMRDWSIFSDGVYHHHIRHVYFTRLKPTLLINNYIFKKKIKKIVKDFGIEIIVCAPSHYLHGFPPFYLNIPIVFDYLDFLHDFRDPNKENTKILYQYYEHASKILCISKTLIDSMPTKYKEKAEYLPNGVDLDFYRNYENLEKNSNTKYISLIGLNISESLFYLDIFPKIKERVNQDIKMVLVGGGIRFPIIKNYILKKKNPSDFILTGFVPYNQVRKYFFMTDVGLNPTLKNRYYDVACPLKVMEYSAASKPIVSTELAELRRLNFPNIFLAKPNTEDFLEKILMALNYKGEFPNLEEYDWKNLSKKLDKILHEI